MAQVTVALRQRTTWYFSPLRKNGLDELMDMCYRNSVIDQYLYNAGKCNTVVFNECHNDFQTSRRKWQLGNDNVIETDKYTHLGSICDKNMNLKTNISESCSKLRKTYFSLNNCGAHAQGLNPITVKHLYQTIVLPKALYGCELWSGITETQVQSLERAHRQCVKHMQSMARSTRTDIALGCIGLIPIECEI